MVPVAALASRKLLNRIAANRSHQTRGTLPSRPSDDSGAPSAGSRPSGSPPPWPPATIPLMRKS